MAAEMLSIYLCGKIINRHLVYLNLPCETYSQTFGTEEDVYMRLYDIEHFGMPGMPGMPGLSKCIQVQKMWIEKENVRNQKLAFLSLI
jgi:hypothetical protein